MTLTNLTAKIATDPERKMPVADDNSFGPDFTESGHSEMDLRIALEAVRDTSNWKMPVRASFPVLTEHETALVYEALIWFAGSPAEIYAEADGSVTVEAAGYYNCIGA